MYCTGYAYRGVENSLKKIHKKSPRRLAIPKRWCIVCVLTERERVTPLPKIGDEPTTIHKGVFTMEKKFRIEYWEHSATTIDVLAENEEEALEKAQEIVEGGELDLSTMELGDCGYEMLGEVTDED